MSRKGFSVIELVVVLVIMGIALAVALPSFRASPSQKVKAVATQLVRDLEMARTRALGSKRAAELVFNVTANSYVGYLDDDGNGTFKETATEMRALRWHGVSELSPDVQFGRGSVTAPVPGDTTTGGAVTFANSRLTFGTNGITTPFGSGGTIYLVSKTKPGVVAAVSVTGAGSFKLWLYKGNGAWQ